MRLEEQSTYDGVISESHDHNQTTWKNEATELRSVVRPWALMLRWRFFTHTRVMVIVVFEKCHCI